MLLDTTIRRIAGKELTLFFSSPVAYLFLGAFAAITLFIFFWGATFFARNIADVRPLFEWMPILLIFLSSALTMRMWSEERRSGTLEHVLTQPIGIWRFVIAKFLACFALLCIALAITLPLPITVSLVGNLDWGPVWSGYLATLLLGGAYLAVGLFVSARSDNQIVSLISATALCGLLYLIGAPAITDFFGNQAGEWMRSLGTGARFESITRGMLDIRDFVYFLSLIAIFLTLNTFSLERERWATTGDRTHHMAWRVGTLLLVANALAVNLWLGQINLLRLDTTQGRIYSISEATRGYLAQLREPLLIRGYFSAKTHPLLAPLVPQLRDLIREYAVAGHGKVRAEFIDPISDPELEQQANKKYGIEPVPLRVADRYQSSLVNSYFNVLIQYGDQYQVLGFPDLIEIQQGRGNDIDVRLRNPEYDITRAIKKVLLAYQSGGNLFNTVNSDLVFTAYLSADDKLPPKLVKFKEEMKKVLDDEQAKSGGRLKVNYVDPEANGGQVARQILDDYGFRPMAESLFDSNRFFFYLTLRQGDTVVQIPLGDLSSANFELAFESGVKHFANGFTKTVALVTPKVDPQKAQYGFGSPRFNRLETQLGSEFNVRHEDLSDGSVDNRADVLLLAAPTDLDKTQLFAVDQFLMRGGTVIAATSPFNAGLSQKRLSLEPHTSGLAEWLQHDGLTIEDKLVMDPQNSAFALPVTRKVGSISVQEMRMIDYPYFADLRGDGLNPDSPITSGLNQLSMAWSSPISVDSDKNKDRKITELLHSSAKSWLSDSRDIMPRISSAGGSVTYTPEGKQAPRLLGVIAQGRFDSFFAGQESPLLSQDQQGGARADGKDNANRKADEPVITSVIEHSPESARIILFSSNDFLSDQVIQLAEASTNSEHLGGLQLMQNTVDWSVADQNLLGIRSRGHFNRTLFPLKPDQQLFLESGNYLLAILFLVALAVLQTYLRRKKSRRYYNELSV
ncbi:MAG: Gldg family protein [Gammaproteobacteria bacterium]|jgi:ABC-2 type transport system permease protein